MNTVPLMLARAGAVAEENAARLVGAAVAGRVEAVEAVRALTVPPALGDVPCRVLDAIRRLAEQGKPVSAETVFRECGGDPGVAVYASECIFKPAVFPHEAAADVRAFGRELEKMDIAETIAGRLREGHPADDLAARLIELEHDADGELQPVAVSTAPEPMPPLFQNGPPPASFAVILGDSGIGKSYVALTLAASLVTRCTVWRAFAPTKPLRVALVAAEDDAAVVKKRMTAICNAAHVPVADVWQAEREGRLAVFGDLGGPLFTLDQYGVVTPTATHEKLAGWLRKNKPDVCFLDPLASLAEISENDNSGVNAVAQTLARLAASTGTAIIVSHHVNKASARGGDNTQHASRGGSALTARSRWVALLTRDGKSLTLGTVKNSYAPLTVIDLERAEGGALVEVDPEKALDRACGELRAYLVGHPGAALTVSAISKYRDAGKTMLDALDWTAGFAGRVLDRALRLGVVSLETRKPDGGGKAFDVLIPGRAVDGYEGDDDDDGVPF